MFEKVNKYHPDKIADRISGAIVDLAYIKNSGINDLKKAIENKNNNPKIAVECLIGHNQCNIIIESSLMFEFKEIEKIVERITKQKMQVNLLQVPQDTHLSENQSNGIKVGDNGIFKGVKTSKEEYQLSTIARDLSDYFKSDGKYIIDGDKIIICQSNAKESTIREIIKTDKKLIINPLGEWTGGTDVDTGATNRKLGSDMGRAVTGGGLHGKDLSKADVSINIYLHILSQKVGEINCVSAIGDEYVTINNRTIPYEVIVNDVRYYVTRLGGFEKLAEWGLI